MKQWYSNETEEHNIVLHQHSATLNSATLKNTISKSKTLNQCNIK